MGGPITGNINDPANRTNNWVVIPPSWGRGRNERKELTVEIYR